MKKFFGVLVALSLFVCLLAPVSLAANSDLDELVAFLEENGISADDVDLDSVDDFEALLNELQNDSSALESLRAAVYGTEADEANVEANIDLGFLGTLFAGDADISALTNVLSGLSDTDFTSLLGTVSGAFSGAGIDLASFNLGTDVATLLGGADLAETATNLTAGIMDTIKGALEMLGLDPAIVEGLLDNEIVNFFANMYIGFVGEVEETKPPVATTNPPKTGDTSAVIVALGTLAVASAAAFVCLKKKED